MKRIICLLVLVLLLPGCSYLNLNTSRTAKPADIYVDEFADIPLPQSMKVDRDESMISVTADGSKIGLITASGSVDKISLSSAMLYNMTQNGWTLRGLMRGTRIVNLFEKDNRFAVLNIYDRPASVALELWVGQRLVDGAVLTNIIPVMEAAKPAADTGTNGLEPFETIPAK